MTDRELLENMLSEIKSIKIQQHENTLILKALEHSAEVNKAEHDRMFNDIDHMKGHLKNIDEIRCSKGNTRKTRSRYSSFKEKTCVVL